MATWECFVCSKLNVHDEAAADDACECRCCGRPRDFIPKSRVDDARAKPLALHALATAQHEISPTLVRALRRAGLALPATDSAGWTALHCAAKLGEVTAIRCLLQPIEREEGDAGGRSAFIEATRAGGWRALHLAVAGGHLAAVEELLLAGADVDAKLDASDDAQTPLSLAAAKGHVEILDLLLQCGADPALCTAHLRRSPLHVAVAAGHERCVHLLLSRADLVRLRDGDGLTALELACLLPASSAEANRTRREIVALLEAHGSSSAVPTAQMRALLG